MVELGWWLCAVAFAVDPAVPDPAPAAPEVASPVLLDGLDAATSQFFQRAEEASSAGSHGRAAALYRVVLQSHPDYLPASLGLARALFASGDRAGAVALWRSMDGEPDAVEALAGLAEADGSPEALPLWRRLQTLRLGDPLPYLHEARILVGSDVDGALAAWSTYQTLLQGAEPEGETLLRLVSALATAGRYAEAQALGTGFLTAFPTSPNAPRIHTLLDRVEIEEAATVLPVGGAEPLTDAQSLRARLAESALRDGNLEGALAIARDLVAAAPRSDLAHALYADVLLAQEDWSEAEIQLVLARSLAPDNQLHHVRLADLLVRAYGGRRNAEALDELRQAVALAPGQLDLRHRLATLEEEAGEFDRATRDFTAVVAAAPDSPAGQDAARRLEALARVRPVIEAPPSDRPLGLPDVAARHYRIALVYLGRGRTTEAADEVALALAAVPDAPLLLNLKARLRRQAGDLAGAREALLASLAAAPGQGEVLLALGELAEQGGDRGEAEARYRAAAEAGQADAHYLLARLAEGRGDWSTVRAEIAAFDGTSTGASLYDEGARQLGEEASRRMWTGRLAAGGAILAALGIPVWIVVRRRTASTLRELLDGVPESWHDAARLLAALRHEVLKHHTTVLPDVAAALEAGDRAPYEALVARLPPVIERFEGYVEGLEGLGRRYGHRLDLRRKDPTLAPMVRVFRRLARLRPGSPPDPRALRAWSEVVNERGYAEIGRMVQEICVLPVTGALVEAVYARVTAEPGFAGEGVPPLTVEVEPGAHNVRMFRADLEDILANLLRNAVGAGATELHVAVGEDLDPITGHAWTELRVVDDAPGALTNAMIRGRYIGRGLGLAVDLVNRHGGTIGVAAAPDAPGGRARKAVVVQLPAVEAASVEVEWAT